MSRFYETDKIKSYSEFIVDIDDEDLEDMSEYERDSTIDQITKEVLDQRLDWGWEILDGEVS